jgi:thioredoxin 1
MSIEPFQVTDANFEETIKNNNLVLVDFWATWCGHCRPLAPIVEEITKDYVRKAVIGKLDVDRNPATAHKLQVFSMPTIIVFKNGQEAERLVGLCSKKSIESILDRHLK